VRARIRLTADWVTAATAGSAVEGAGEQEFAGVSIDSRTVKPSELYVGIRGERFDGADFAQAAIDAGAAGTIVGRGRGREIRSATGARPPFVLEVDDTTAALQAIAHRVRVESGTRIVAITGSAGKTTTKEATAEFLATKYDVIRNRGNFNNHIGLPLSLMELTRRPDIAVVELGMNHAGEIRTLVRIAEPDVRVWTNVGEAHLGFFPSLDAIADAKAEVLEGANEDTVLVANADDDRVVARIGRFAGRRITFGIDRDADVWAEAIVDRGIDGVAARVETPRGGFDLETPLLGRANLANLLAATAVALEFDVAQSAIVERAARLRPSSHRGEVRRLASVTIIDDSYNANPTATRLALDVLRRTEAQRRVAILGEMLELGDRAAALHENIGREAAASSVDVLVAVGGSPAAALARAAVAAGMRHDRVYHVGSSDEAGDVAVRVVQSGDVVLVKGSRGIRTDQVVERLAAEFA